MAIGLKNGSASAAILEKGAELRSLNLSGKEIMWRADPAYWGKSSPLLFPMIGNLRGGRTIIGGKEYAITKHGFARDNMFETRQISDSEAEFSFVSNDETKRSFPFDFKLTLKYSLYTDKLEMLYTVENTGSSEMPYCIGAHPAFACPNEENAQFSDYKLIFAENETVKSPVMNLITRMWGDNDRIERLNNSKEFRLEYSLFDNDCVYFDTIRSNSVSLVSEKSGHGVKISWDGFETLGVWTPDHKNAPFVCIEPWCGCDDYDTDSGNFSDKRGIQITAPGEKKEYRLTIKEV